MIGLFEVIKSVVVGLICVIVTIAVAIGIAFGIFKYFTYFFAAACVYCLVCVCWFVGEKVRGKDTDHIFQDYTSPDKVERDWDVYS